MVTVQASSDARRQADAVLGENARAASIARARAAGGIAPVRNALEAARLEPIQSVPMRDTLLEPVSLFHVQDYGDWFMVRAANMKITVERATGKIVNVSGGGCPDVPYLAALLTGQCIGEAEEPRVKGQTLCSYSLQRAFEEAKRLWRG